MPRDSRQIYCLPCRNKPCPRCGGKKKVTALTCKSCEPSKVGVPRAPRKKVLPAIDCIVCGATFNPGNTLQKYCFVCIEQSHICVDCGVQKHRSVRGPRCRRCTDLHRINNPRERQPREEKPVEQIISEVEAFGLLPAKQYAFGYVMGVVFGDGSITKETNRIPDGIRSDGTMGYHDATIHRVRLSVTSQAFAERFAERWEVLTGKPAKVYTSVRTNFEKSTLKGRREEGYTVQLFNVRQCHVLLTRYLAYLKYDSELYELLRFPNEVLRGFIHGMIDSEGYLNPKVPRRIDIANKKVTLLDVMVFMFELLGYKATIYTSPSQSVAHLVTYMDYGKYIG